MNERQTKFCENYAKSGNAVQSYIDAGYDIKSEAGARASSSKLLTNANIQKKLTELSESVRSEAIADITEIKEFWTSTMRSTEENMSDRARASELLAKVQGAFIEKQEISHVGHITMLPVKDKDN